MGLLSDAIQDVGTIVGNVPDIVNDTLSLDVGGVVDDVGNVVDDTVDTVSNLLGNILGEESDDGTSPTAQPSNPTDSSTTPTVTSQPTNDNPPPSNPTSTSTSSSDSSDTHSGGEAPTSSPTTEGEEDATTPSSSPSATGTVQPNPVVLPHNPSSNDGGDSPSDGSGNTNTGTGTDIDGGNAPGGSLPDGGDKKLGGGAVAGIAIVSAIFSVAVLMCLVRCYFIRRRRAKRHAWTHRPTTMMIQANSAGVSGGGAPRLSSDAGDAEAGRATRESYHSGSSFGTGAPARESYHSDEGPATVESFQSVGSTHESNLFTGPPPMPSWSRASRTQQRRFLHAEGESSSAENENFGTIIQDSRIAWTAPRSPPPVIAEPHPAAAVGVYQTSHANQHLMDDAISLSESSSGCITVESGSSFAAGSSSEGTPSVEMHESGLAYARSPSPQELPARSSTHLSGEFSTNWLGGPSPGSTPSPTSTGFGAISTSSSTTPLMAQFSPRPTTLAPPMAVPLHMIVPSQSPPPPPSVPLPVPLHMIVPSQSPPPPPGVPLPVPLHMIVPSQSPPPAEHRTFSELFAQADPFASPLDQRQRS